MVTLSEDQRRRLAVHAVARAMTPEQALQALLDQPPPAPARSSRPWTADELALVRNSKNSPRDIARTTGRTPSAISNMRTRLRAADAAALDPTT